MDEKVCYSVSRRREKDGKIDRTHVKSRNCLLTVSLRYL